MRFHVRDIAALLANPLGRRQLRRSLFHFFWPVLSRAAAVHRRTLARPVRVVAVAGSLGKTTTTRAVQAVLGGTHEGRSGANSWSTLAWRVLRMRPGDRHCVIEVGIDRPGRMAGYARLLRPDVTVVTCIASEHHRSLGSLEVTRREKAELVRALGPGGLAVLNGDDPNVRWMAGLARSRVVTFGLGEGNDVRGTDLRLDWPAGTRFTLHAGGQSREAFTRLIGPPGVYACLAASAAGLAEGLGLEDILPALERLAPTPGRLEPVALPNGAILLRDDFKSAPETIELALDVLGQIPATRRVAVLGEISEPSGSQGDAYRRLGARVARVASRAIFICGRKNTAYRAGAVGEGMPRSAIVRADDLFEAAEVLRGELSAGDVVLIKGRDVQKLDRITLLLQGRAVGCTIPTCRSRVSRCADCPALACGWGGSTVMQVR